VTGKRPVIFAAVVTKLDLDATDNTMCRKGKNPISWRFEHFNQMRHELERWFRSRRAVSAGLSRDDEANGFMSRSLPRPSTRRCQQAGTAARHQ
jgi:hypothetical protein